MAKKYSEPKFFLPVLLIILPTIVYWFTKPPSILYIDSGTMIAASYTLGIPNPPGFPFYMLASHLFAILPIFNVLTRLELFTIVFSLLALQLIYRIILLIISSDFFFHKSAKTNLNLNLARKPIENLKYFSAFVGAICLAFSYQYWSQSQNTEAFIFTDFFLCLFLYILLLIQTKKTLFLSQNNKKIFSKYLFRGLFLLAFFYGLAAGANPTIAVLVPGVLYVIFLNRKFLNVGKLLALGLVFIATIALVYSYLPIRASTWPFVNWGNPQTLSLFIGHLRGEGLNIYQPDAGVMNGFTGSPIVFFRTVSNFFYLLLIQFTPLLLPFIFWGGYVVFKKNKYLFSLLISVPIINIIYSGIYLSGNQESWFILSWIICSIFIGIGFYFLIIKIKYNYKYIKLIFLLCFLPLIVWFIPLNRSGHYYSSDYASNLYSKLKPNAILIGSGDFLNSLGFYLHEADKFRPDVIPVISNNFYVNKWYRDDLRHVKNIYIAKDFENLIQYKDVDEYNKAMNKLINDNIDKHPIYVTHLTFRSSAIVGTDMGRLALDSRFKFIPNGLSLEVVRSNVNAEPNLEAFNYRFQNINPEKKPFYLEKNYSNSFFNMISEYAYGWEQLGDWFLDNKQYDQALYYYRLANNWLPNDFEIISRIGLYYGSINENDISRQFLEKALKIQPSSLTVRYDLAISLTNLGRIDEAIQNYIIIQQSDDQSLAQKARDQVQLLLSSHKNSTP